MKLIECSAQKLKRVSKKKKIICFGAGDRLNRIFAAFPDLKIEKNVSFILDNDEKKWQDYRLLNGEKIEIKKPSLLKEINVSDYIIVITTYRVNEVFAQIQNYTNNVETICIKDIPYRFQAAFWLEKIISFFPLKNSIVFQGEGDTCENAVALGKELLKSNAGRKYKIYWLCDHPKMFHSTKQETHINRNSNLADVSFLELLKYINATNRSKYLIFENQMIKKKRDTQISVYLNHGAPPLKATKGKINLANNLNYSLCPSVACADIVSEQFSINKERLLYCGSPRTDVLFDDQIHEGVAQLFNRKLYKKIILWVPTFRQFYRYGRIDSKKEYKSGMPIVEEEMDWIKLADELEKEEVLLLIKPHLYQDLTKLKIKKNKYIIFVTQNDLNTVKMNVYDLMKACDAMITDYSTIAFDFMHLDRPIGYTIDDINEYTLGFSVNDPLTYMPGNKINDMNEYISFIHQIAVGDDLYKEERNSVSRLVHGDFSDGKNAKRLINLLGL
ncbi:MAG: hypothetical protein HDR02_12840 [Lachnospiraceae bacterium]|nr:hypothetical protein [Lachnospiraceae bacterium]